MALTSMTNRELLLLIIGMLGELGGKIRKEGEAMADKFDEAVTEIETALQENTDATSSVEQLVTELLDKIEAEADNPDQVRALAAKIRANTQVLSAAVKAGTEDDDEFEPSAN
jgi:plasmid stabilization system protein ParE